MKRMILVFVFLFCAAGIKAMWNDLESDIDGIWSESKQELLELGMKEEDLDASVPKDYSLEKSKLTDFWRRKEEDSQEEKNKLLIKILTIWYPKKFWNLGRIHIASAVMIGANPNAHEFNPKKW